MAEFTAHSVPADVVVAMQVSIQRLSNELSRLKFNQLLTPNFVS